MSPFTLFFFFMLLFLFFFLLLWVDAFHFPVFVLILSSPWSALLLTVSHCVFRFTSYTFMLCDFRLALFCTFHFFAEILTWFMHCSPDFSEYVYACSSLYQAYQLPLFHSDPFQESYLILLKHIPLLLYFPRLPCWLRGIRWDSYFSHSWPRGLVRQVGIILQPGWDVRSKSSASQGEAGGSCASLCREWGLR